MPLAPSSPSFRSQQGLSGRRFSDGQKRTRNSRDFGKERLAAEKPVVGTEHNVRIQKIDKNGNGVGAIGGFRVLTDCPHTGIVYRVKVVQVLEKIARAVWLDRPGGPINWPPVQVNRVYVMDITDSDEQGHGIARYYGLVCIIKKGKQFVGQKVRVLVWAVRPTFIGGIVYMKDPFPNRPPPLPDAKTPSLATATP